MKPHSQFLGIQQSANILCDRLVLLKLEKLSLLMFISKSKAQQVDKLLCLMFVGRDGCTANAEHQRQLRRHLYVAYGPPHGRYAWFAMPDMFGASAAEVRALLISSEDFRGFESALFASQALPHLLIPGFLHFT